MLKTDAYLNQLLERKSENDAAIRDLRKSGKLIQNAIKAITKIEGDGSKPKRRKSKKAAGASSAAAA